MENNNQQLNRTRYGWRAPRDIGGVTLLELLVVIAIVAVLSAIAAPSFVATTKKFRVAAEAEAFAGDLQVARSEALKRGLAVIMCPSVDATTCAATNAWQNGWLIYTQAADGSTVRVKVQSSWSTASKVNTDTLSGSNPAPYSITFSRDGYAQGLTSGATADTFTLATVPALADAAKCVVLSKTGRQKIQACS